VLTNSQLTSVNEYCKLNDIEDIDKFIVKCFTGGFNTTKYGLLGDDSGKTSIVEEKQVEIEVIREIRVEVPVEVIKEVEVIKVVEVIKEVPTPPTEIEVIKYVDREVIREVKVEVPVPIIEEKRDEPEPIIIEKIVEVIKEVPVDRIIEVEKVVEVIKEVIVEVDSGNDKLKLIQETLQKLRKELSLKNTRIEELEKINKQLESSNIERGAVYMKGSNLTENL
jgi:hypothetical protein